MQHGQQISDSSIPEELYGGYVAGPVVTAIDRRGYVGAVKGSSGAAELSAHAWAAMIILQFGRRCQVVIEYDSEYAAGITQARSNAKTNHDLAAVATGLFTLASNQADVCWAHVKAH